jgi:hypothetical protein
VRPDIRPAGRADMFLAEPGQYAAVVVNVVAGKFIDHTALCVVFHTDCADFSGFSHFHHFQTFDVTVLLRVDLYLLEYHWELVFHILWKYF